MARPVKKPHEQWENEILRAAQALFVSQGYEETSVADIMKAVGGAKGMFYRCFASKEEVMMVLGDKMFLDNNPFDAVKGRTDLNGLQKIRQLLLLDQSDAERDNINMQAIPILKDPRILAAAIESNCRILTPLWLALLTEGIQDGSIQTEYAKEISELLPLVNFWLLPSVFPDTAEGIHHKFQFIQQVLVQMGVPIFDDKLAALASQKITDISPN